MDDVFVSQTGRGSRFIAKSLQLPRVHGRRIWQHLQRDAPIERNLLRFVYDTHSTSANFPHDAIIAERTFEAWLVNDGCRTHARSHSLNKFQRLETFAKFIGDIGISRQDLLAIRTTA